MARTFHQSFWLLAFPGWLRIGISDGALAVIAPHVRQLGRIPSAPGAA